MRTKLVKIVPDTVGWGEWLWDKAKNNPGRAAGLVVAASFAIPLEATVLFGGALIGGITALTVGAVSEFVTSPDQFEKLPLKEAYALRDIEGVPISVNQMYARHPNLDYNNVVLLAENFHSRVIAEQIADLISYIRSVVAAKYINIAVYAESGAHLDATGLTKVGNVSVQGHSGTARHHSAENSYAQQIIVPATRSLFWMRNFPEVQAALIGSKEGSFTRSVKVDTTFGLSASLAKVAGIDINWLGKQRFVIRVDYG